MLTNSSCGFHHTRWNPTGTGEDIWQSFATDGSLPNSTDETPEIIEKIQKDYEYINVLDWKECKDIIDSVDKN